VRISGSNAGYTMFRGRAQDYWLPIPLACFPFTSPPCVTVCHQVSTELYNIHFNEQIYTLFAVM